MPSSTDIVILGPGRVPAPSVTGDDRVDCCVDERDRLRLDDRIIDDAPTEVEPAALGMTGTAMSGRMELVLSQWHGRFVHVPMPLAISERKQVDPRGALWWSVLESTGQPNWT